MNKIYWKVRILKQIFTRKMEGICCSEITKTCTNVIFYSSVEEWENG